MDRNERQRDFETLRPQADHEDICGRRFVRQSRIVGGQVASYGEWPWQVCTYLVPEVITLVHVGIKGLDYQK